MHIRKWDRAGRNLAIESLRRCYDIILLGNVFLSQEPKSQAKGGPTYSEN